MPPKAKAKAKAPPPRDAKGRFLPRGDTGAGAGGAGPAEAPPKPVKARKAPPVPPRPAKKVPPPVPPRPVKKVPPQVINVMDEEIIRVTSDLPLDAPPTLDAPPSKAEVEALQRRIVKKPASITSRARANLKNVIGNIETVGEGFSANAKIALRNAYANLKLVERRFLNYFISLREGRQRRYRAGETITYKFESLTSEGLTTSQINAAKKLAKARITVGALIMLLAAGGVTAAVILANSASNKTDKTKKGGKRKK